MSPASNTAKPGSIPHSGGIVLPDRGDGLHWLRCFVCGREWAEKDSGAFAAGDRYCETPDVMFQSGYDGFIA